MLRVLGHSFAIILLTLISQLGGLAWGLAILFRRRLIAFVLIYAGLSCGAWGIAPYFGRVPIACHTSDNLRVQSWMYCVLNRTYVTPKMAEVLTHTADAMAEAYPGTQTLMLDGNFPFVTGFPLLPHLSHDDGEKADFAFYYAVAGEYQPGFTKSPLGYFAFEDGQTQCRKQWPSLRWDFRALQMFWPDAEVEWQRTRAVVAHLVKDPRVGKIFLEPHLVQRLGLMHPKVRFQGCRAARHDDHIHVQL